MRDKLQTIIDKHAFLSEQMTDPSIFNDQKKLTTIAKEHSSLESIVNVGKDYLSVLQNIDDDKSILDSDDSELKEIAQEELIDLESRKAVLEDCLLYTSPSPRDKRQSRIPSCA